MKVLQTQQEQQIGPALISTQIRKISSSRVSHRQSGNDRCTLGIARFRSGQHDAPVKEVFVLDEMNMVVSGSWDRTLRHLSALSLLRVDKLRLLRWQPLISRYPNCDFAVILGFWNLQQPTPVATLQLPERLLGFNLKPLFSGSRFLRVAALCMSRGVYTMDVKYPLLVVGCAERHVCLCCKMWCMSRALPPSCCHFLRRSARHS